LLDVLHRPHKHVLIGALSYPLPKGGNHAYMLFDAVITEPNV
jgi:hypothetical protein